MGGRLPLHSTRTSSLLRTFPAFPGCGGRQGWEDAAGADRDTRELLATILDDERATIKWVLESWETLKHV
jgi:hypothetical protein